MTDVCFYIIFDIHLASSLKIKSGLFLLMAQFVKCMNLLSKLSDFGVQYFYVANLVNPSSQTKILNGSIPAKRTYILKSNFKSSIKNGLCIYLWTTHLSYFNSNLKLAFTVYVSSKKNSSALTASFRLYYKCLSFSLLAIIVIFFQLTVI